METVESSTDWQYDMRGAKGSTGPHLHSEPLYMTNRLQTTIQY
jgi:murein DD-endopeptidase MepM/ murein hydrolase activator NlpD